MIPSLQWNELSLIVFNKSSSDLYSGLLSLPPKIAGNSSLLIVSIDALIPWVLKISSNASVINAAPSPYLLDISKV